MVDEPASVESELIAATRIKILKKDTRQKFLGRLVKKIWELDGDDWEALSSEAQDWTNEAVKVINREEGGDIADFIVELEVEEEEIDELELEEEVEATLEDAVDDALERMDENEDRSSAGSGSAGEDSSDGNDNSVDEEKVPETLRNQADLDKTDEEVEQEYKEAQEKLAPKRKLRPVTQRIKELILDDHTVTKAQLITSLTSEGYKPSPATVELVRADFRQSLRVLFNEGHIGIDVDSK